MAFNVGVNNYPPWWPSRITLETIIDCPRSLLFIEYYLSVLILLATANYRSIGDCYILITANA